MNKTKIDWADSTWNPVTGCLHGCEYCYARRITHRYTLPKGATGKLHDLSKPYTKAIMMKSGACQDRTIPYPYDFDPTFHRYRLDDYKNKKGRTIFVGSMTDLFGEWVPDEWIQEVFKACEAAPQHRYLFLTKNPERYNNYFSFRNNRPDNFYFGASATNYNDIVTIRQTLANSLNFLSVEPLHGDIDLGKFIYENPKHLSWVIIGAETGNRKNKIIPKREWIESIVNECKRNNIPVFMKNSLTNIWGESLIQQYPWEV